MRLVPVAFLLALVLAATALAAPSAAKDPSQLILVRADLPAAAKYSSGAMPSNVTQALAAAGIKAEGAFFSAAIGGTTTKYQEVEGVVFSADSASQAKKLYALTKQDLDRRGTTALRLPSYGDEQLALISSPKLGSKVEVLVRKNGVVWQLETRGAGLLVIPRAKLIGEIKKYAAMLQRRVAAG